MKTLVSTAGKDRKMKVVKVTFKGNQEFLDTSQKKVTIMLVKVGMKALYTS